MALGRSSLVCRATWNPVRVPAGLPSCGTPILRAAFSRLPHPRAVLGAAAAQYGRTTHCGHVGRPGEGALPPRQEALPARRKQSSKYE